MGKRPRTISRDYEYDDEIKEAPDTGEPVEKKDHRILGKLDSKQGKEATR